MRSFSFFLLGSAVFGSLVTLFACTAAPTLRRLPPEDDPGDDTPTPSQKDSGPAAQLPPGADPPLPDGGKPPGRVYAHTNTELYRYDPLSNALVDVGPFSCLPRNETKPDGDLGNDDVIDIALDRTGQMYATTFWRFLKVDATSGACEVIRTDSFQSMYPNSLSFVPMGSEEALVGYAFDGLNNANIYTRIDLTTGEMNDLGVLNPTPLLGGQEYAISGDIISLIRTNGKTYAAIKQVSGDAGAMNDLLAEVEPATGALKSIIGDTGQQGFYGLGFWAGTAYGFTSTGAIYAIDVTNGSSKLMMQAKDQNGLSVSWYGAGVTTDSPTAP